MQLKFKKFNLKLKTYKIFNSLNKVALSKMQSSEQETRVTFQSFEILDGIIKSINEVQDDIYILLEKLLEILIKFKETCYSLLTKIKSRYENYRNNLDFMDINEKKEHYKDISVLFRH